MLGIPEEIKDLYRSNNTRDPTVKHIEINFYIDQHEMLYPSETLYPADDLYPSDRGEPWLTISGKKILSGSFKLSESLCSDSDIRFGACEAAELEFTCADIDEVMIGQEFEATIRVSDYKMSLGTYTVKSVERQADRRYRKVTGYDKMIRFDADVVAWYNGFFADKDQQHTLKEFRDSLCAHVGVAQDQADLVNDKMIVDKTLDTNQLNGREVLVAICEINGVFGHFDRTGQLKYIGLKNTGLYPSETLYPADDLYPSEPEGFEEITKYRSVEYEDYVVNPIDRLEIRDEEGLIGSTVGAGENCYIIEGNFLIYDKNAADRYLIAENVYDQISGRFYRPHKTVCNGLPYMEVGDGLLISTRDELIESFIFTRTLSGIQALKDEYAATGNEYREEVFGINKEIIQLKGKTAVITKEVDRVAVELKDFEADTSSKFEQTAEQISLRVEKDKVIAAINLTAEEAKIQAKRITLEGLTTINGYFKVLLDGSIEAVNGKFSGEIKVAQITGSHFTGGSLNVGLLTADDEQASIGGFVSTSDGRDIFQSFDETTGLSGNSGASGGLYGWFGYRSGSNYAMLINNNRDVYVGRNLIVGSTLSTNGDIHADDIYLAGSFWDGWSLTEEIKLLHNKVFYGEG